MAKHNIAVSCMISLEVDTPELVKRLLERGKVSGRADDQNEDVIMNRIKVYNSETAPVKDFYAKQGKLKEIKGVGTIDNIFASICDVCDKF